MPISRETLIKEYQILLSAVKDEKTLMIPRCIDWLTDVDLISCFKLVPFGNIIDGYLMKTKKEKKVVKFDQMIELECALKSLESYTQNLLKKPWCKDFYTIKIFNGFFKYKIEQWIPLDAVCKILTLMGYQKISEGIFEIVDLDRERVLMVGLDLYLAHTQLFVFGSNDLLKDYPVEGILDAWSQTTGNPTKIYEWLYHNCLAKESLAHIYSEPSSGSIHETFRSDAITTPTQCQHYDKNGQSASPIVKYSSACSFDKSRKSDEISEVSQTRIISLPVTNFQVSDDQLYGDEPDTGIEVNNGDLQSYQNPSFPKSRHEAKYNMDRDYPSLPAHSEARGNYSKLKSRDDIQFKNYCSSKDFSDEQFYGTSFEGIVPSQSKSENNIPASGVLVYSRENVVIVGEKPEKSESFSVQNTTQENLDENNEKWERILQARVEAGEKDLRQLPKKPAEIIPATDFTKEKVENLQCYICSSIAFIACEICEETVCVDCLRILMKKPCKDNGQHVYRTINNKEDLYENASSLHLGERGKKERQLACVDLNKWQCTHCTYLNSLKTLVCYACSRTKDVKVQNPTPGNWECFECTLANPENVRRCKACGIEKEKNPYSSFV